MAAVLALIFLACGEAPREESQGTPFDSGWDVVNLGPPLNSPAGDGFPTVTEDGLELYFASTRAASDTDVENWDIYVSTRTDWSSEWSEPVRLGDHINTPATEHSVTFSPDGRRMYFSSTRPGGCGGLDLYVSEREDPPGPTGWGEPKHLGCELNSSGGDVCAIYFVEGSGDHALYFVSSREGGIGGWDVYRSYLDEATGAFGVASIVEAVSSDKNDFHLDPIAGFMWTDREGGMGSADIWRASRGPNGEWLEPVHAGPALNTEYQEQLPSPLNGGQILFFPSDRPGGLGGLDLYEAVAR